MIERILEGQYPAEREVVSSGLMAGPKVCSCQCECACPLGHGESNMFNTGWATASNNTHAQEQR